MMKRIKNIDEKTRSGYIRKFKIIVKPKVPFKKINKKYDVDVAVYLENHIMYVIFKGSDSFVDWKLNLSFWKKPYKKMDKLILVHSGQSKGYKVARDYIHTFYNKHKASIKKVFIGGFSLGDSYGRFCYEDFFWHRENHEDYKQLELEGFGGGGNKNVGIIGFREWDRRLKGYVRLENHNDLVPRVPFFWMFYKKTGDFYRINRRSFLSFFLLLPSHLYHHNPSSYLGYLKDPKNFKDTNKNNNVKKKCSQIVFLIYLMISIVGLSVYLGFLK